MFVVLNPEEYLCSSKKPLALPDSGYLLRSSSSPCGAADRPYVIRLPPGQTIALKLLDFHLPLTDSRPVTSAQRCDVYAIIREPFTNRRQDVCGGQIRENVVFTSSSNIIELQMQEFKGDDAPQFLIHYESKFT